MSTKTRAKVDQNTIAAKRPLVVDWSRFLEKDANGEYVIPITGASKKQKGWHIPWKARELEYVESCMTVFTNVPIKCKGHECPFKNSCPLIKHNVVERAIGENCPVEIVDAFRYFAGYVVDLGIQPNDYTDIQMINDIVRLQLMINRCDKLLQNEDPISVIIEGVDAKTTLRHNNRGPHPLVVQQQMLRRDMDVLYQRLVASREARLLEESRRGKSKDMVSQLSALMEKARQERLAKQQETTQSSEDPQFSDDSSSKEESNTNIRMTKLEF